MHDIATVEDLESKAHAAGPVGRDAAAPRALAEASKVAEEQAAVLSLVADGTISLLRATDMLDLPDAGHVLSLMREQGVRPYRHRDPAAAQAAAALVAPPIRAANAPIAKDRSTKRS